jgi:hypothetical protein
VYDRTLQGYAPKPLSLFNPNLTMAPDKAHSFRPGITMDQVVWSQLLDHLRMKHLGHHATPYASIHTCCRQVNSNPIDAEATVMFQSIPRPDIQMQPFTLCSLLLQSKSIKKKAEMSSSRAVVIKQYLHLYHNTDQSFLGKDLSISLPKNKQYYYPSTQKKNEKTASDFLCVFKRVKTNNVNDYKYYRRQLQFYEAQTQIGCF